MLQNSSSWVLFLLLFVLQLVLTEFRVLTSYLEHRTAFAKRVLVGNVATPQNELEPSR